MHPPHACTSAILLSSQDCTNKVAHTEAATEAATVACRWAGGNGSCGKLLTGSYDGSVRMLDPSTATFELLVSDQEAEFSAMDCLADATSGSVRTIYCIYPRQ